MCVILVCRCKFQYELIDKEKCVNGRVDIEPKVLEGKLGRGVKGVFELGKECTIVLN